MPKFYGVYLDPNDPFLRHNLNRLEKRFRQRYYSSVQKSMNREKAGKPIHKTTLKSKVDNKRRLEMVKVLRMLLVEEKLT